MTQPKDMSDEVWERLVKKAEKYATSAGTHGDYSKNYNTALKFYVGRWRGEAPNMPKSMRKSAGKKYPKHVVKEKNAYPFMKTFFRPN